MRDALGPGTVLGYCTNVHAGATLDETLANLETYAARVRGQLDLKTPMGVGLWLSARAAHTALADARVMELRDCLEELGLMPFTFNGFPYGNFHTPVVKHNVYEPNWNDALRAEYTTNLAHILAVLLEEGDEGSISTVPLGWDDAFARGGEQVPAVVETLRRIEAETGRLIHLDFEPEPGCVMQTAESTVDAFERFLLRDGNETATRRYLRICHDVCHTSVMFEEQRAVLDRYRSHGIGVGKVQISSAVRAQRLEPLRAFAEERYLHQTVVRMRDGTTRFHEDLPLALAAGDDGAEWRVHFHVPVYLERFGAIETSRADVETVLDMRGDLDCRHFEVETYAWDVLPLAMREDDLAAGIARELRFVLDRA